MFRKIKLSRDTYFWTGVFFTVLGSIVAVNNFLYYEIYDFIWYCDIVLVFFAAGFFTKNDGLIKGLLNIGFLTQFIFIIEFLIELFFGISLSETISLILTQNIPSISISLATHLFSTNLALLITYKCKSDRSPLIYSVAAILILYFLTLFFTPPERNINYVFSSEFFFGVKIPFYAYLWPILVFVLVVVPTNWLQEFLYKRTIKKSE